MGGPCGADDIDDLEQESNAVVEGASIRVAALVGEGREEFVEQVAVGGVDLDEVETSVVGAMGRSREGVNNGVDAGLIESLGRGVVGCEPDGTGAEGLPSAFAGVEQAFASEGRGHGGFAACVGELDSGADALGVDELGDAGEAGNVVVGVDAEVGGGDASFGEDRGCLEHNEGGSALGAGPEMNEVPVIGESVLRGVLAHGRDADAVGEGDGAKLKGRKKRMAHDVSLAWKMNWTSEEMMREREKRCNLGGKKGCRIHAMLPTGRIAMRRGIVVLMLAVTCAGVNAQGGASLTGTETEMARTIDAHVNSDLALLEKLVDINSGTMHPEGVVAVKDVLVPRFEALGFKVRWVPMEAETGRAGDLVAEHLCADGEGKCGKRLLLIGHMDTVFEPSSTFQKYAVVANTDGKIATGPGIADMKGGLVVMLAALEAMQESGVLKHCEIRVVLSGDEERVGAPIEVARRDLIGAAKASDVALEFEPSARLNGQDSVSIGRRSSTTWRIEASGVSGHSSQIFGERLGYGAIYELARILDGFREELPEDGLTYNVGLVLGGATAEVNEGNTGGSATGRRTWWRLRRLRAATCAR